MTLNDLIRKALSLSYQLSSGDVPLTFPNGIKDIDLRYHEDGPYIEVELIGETENLFKEL